MIFEDLIGVNFIIDVEMRKGRYFFGHGRCWMVLNGTNDINFSG